MTIFGDLFINYTIPGPVPQLMVYSHTSSVYDSFANSTFAGILVLSTLTGLLLNPVVFYYNYSQKLSTASLLFQILAAMDFLLSLLRPTYQIYLLTKPSLQPFGNLEPTLLSKVVTVLYYAIGQSNISITGLLCGVRLIQIRFPFWAFSHSALIFRVALLLMTADLLYNIAAISGCLIHFKLAASLSVTQMVWAMPADLNLDTFMEIIWFFYCGPYYVKTSLIIVTSTCTVLALSRHQDREDSDSTGLSPTQTRSIRTILILNLGTFVWVLLMAVCQGIMDHVSDLTRLPYSFFYLIYLTFVVTHLLLAAYNPMVLCCRSTGIKKMVFGWCRSQRLSRVGSSSGRFTNWSSYLIPVRSVGDPRPDTEHEI